MAESLEDEAASLTRHALELYNAGQYQKASVVAEEGLAFARRHFPSDPPLAVALNNKAAIDIKLARWKEADASYREMRALIEANDRDEPMVGSAIHGQGLLCFAQGKFAEARAHLIEAVEHFR